MKFNHDKFLTACGNFNDHQRQGMDFLLTCFENDPDMSADVRWIAYAIATIQRETAGTYQPIAEYGKGAGRPYGEPDSLTGQTYYGRGFCQVTWKANYAEFSPITGVDLVAYPDKALDPGIAYKILSYGMVHGSFTGVGLHRYIAGDECDYFNARRIINGIDHAQEIADAAKWFETTLKECLI